MNEHLTTYLATVDWRDISKRLNNYAPKKIQMKANWRRGGRNLPDGRTAEDIVNDAILQLYNETRTWDREKYPDLFMFLKGVVSSLISNAATGKENKICTAYNTSDYGGNEVVAMKSNTLSPEEVQINAETIKTDQELCRRCFEVINARKDNNMSIVFLALFEEIYKPQEISVKTGIEVKEVYNLFKRIYRALEPLKPGFVNYLSVN